MTTSIAGAFPDKQTREGALSTVSRAFVGTLNHACQTVLHPLEAIQLLCSSPQGPYEGSGGDDATQKAVEEEEDEKEEPGRLHQVQTYCKSHISSKQLTAAPTLAS